MLGRTITESGDEDAGKVELCLVLRLYGAGRVRGVCVGVGHRSASSGSLRRETRADGLTRPAMTPMYDLRIARERYGWAARITESAHPVKGCAFFGANLLGLQLTALGIYKFC
jgi:hypothetical protein